MVRDGHISACVLAGGRSTRFGRDKTVFNYRGKPLIRHVCDVVRRVIADITIIGGDPGRFHFLDVPCRPDLIPGMGPLGGIYTALKFSRTEKVFVVAGDMPNLDAALVDYLVSVSAGHAVTVPEVDGLAEPLHAVYSRECIGAIENLIDRGNYSVKALFDICPTRRVERGEIAPIASTESVMKNINYPRDAGIGTDPAAEPVVTSREIPSPRHLYSG